MNAGHGKAELLSEVQEAESFIYHWKFQARKDKLEYFALKHTNFSEFNGSSSTKCEVKEELNPLSLAGP